MPCKHGLIDGHKCPSCAAWLVPGLSLSSLDLVASALGARHAAREDAATIDRLRAENARLREAVRAGLAMGRFLQPGGPDGRPMAAADRVKDAIRTTLGPELAAEIEAGDG